MKTINETIKVLNNGGLVVFPTDTVYGLLCDAANKKAVEKLIQFKERPPGKAISVFCNFAMLPKLVKINDKQKKIIDNVLPGPYTIILPSKHKVEKLLESEKGTLGVRIPNNKYIEQLLKKFNKPLTATSANIASRPPHYSAKTFFNELSEKQKKLIDLVVDIGTLPKNKPSTVVDLTEENVKILRQGDLEFKDRKIFISKTPEETKNIAKNIFKEISLKRKDEPLVIIIEGEMGVGKTIFVKGIGESLGINNIISPTFVIYYEYGNFYHFDLYQIEDKKDYDFLHVDKLLKKNNILCFEWGEKAGEIYKTLKEKSYIVYIVMKYINENKRKISFSY